MIRTVTAIMPAAEELLCWSRRSAHSRDHRGDEGNVQLREGRSIMCVRCTTARCQGEGISHLNVETVDHDGVVVMAISGDIDITNADRARAAIDTQLNNHPVGIVVCLAVGFLASTGLSMLGEANQRARQAGIGFAVVATERASLRPLLATGLDQVLMVHETVPHAVEALRQPPQLNGPISRSDRSTALGNQATP